MMFASGKPVKLTSPGPEITKKDVDWIKIRQTFLESSM